MNSICPNGATPGGEFACAHRGCRICQDALVRAHSGLIHTVLRRVEHRGVPYAALVQEGRLALWQAVLHFEPQRGVQFSTYGGMAVERALWAAVRQARAAEAEPLPGFPGAAPGETYHLPWEVRAALATALAQLPERLRAVLTRRYGLEGHAPETLAAVGQAWGLSRERIRQLQVEALVQLRQPGLSAALYQACERDSREAYLQALRHTRAWQRRRR